MNRQLKIAQAFRNRLHQEIGSAVVDFIMVVPLVVTVFISVAQLVMIGHQRSILVSALDQGVRVASVADGTLAEGKSRIQSVLLDHSIAPDDVTVTLSRSSSSGVSYVLGKANWPRSAIGIDFDLVATSRAIDESKF